MREAFKAKGHDAWSCDLEDTEIAGQHIKGDILEGCLDYTEWDLMIAHPPCTYITNAGVRHLHSVPSRLGKLPKVHGEARWLAMKEACDFFNLFLNASVDKICVENPTPHKYAKQYIGDYTQAIQPWMFGHGETKRTCLWLKNLSPLVPTNIVEGREPRIHFMSPGINRAKERSRTYTGIAKAMAEQWG